MKTQRYIVRFVSSTMGVNDFWAILDVSTDVNSSELELRGLTTLESTLKDVKVSWVTGLKVSESRSDLGKLLAESEDINSGENLPVIFAQTEIAKYKAFIKTAQHLCKADTAKVS